ncbi:MAG: divalent metal cation transporter [Armatimonadota bacterium]|nr:divalent metal cation transporter [Armatimonadota bacterium]
MGPGLIAALAGNDAGGIGTYSFAGAKYGYRLLWLLFVITFALALVQEMAARMGAVTQKGLGELIREHYGVGWSLFALGVMFVANTATTVAEFAGIAAAGEIFGLSKMFTVPIAALLMWLIVTRGPFRLVERIFLAICLVQITYVVAAFEAVDRLPEGQGWWHIAPHLVRPHFSADSDFLLLCVAVIGTTITPWMQFFLQSNIVDKGIRIGQYRYQRADVYAGVVVTNVIAFFIIVCTAATIYPGEPKTAEDVALALSRPLGHWGTYLFATGLLAASLLAAAILPLSTAYTYCEAFGWEIGIQRSVREAPMFYGLFGATMFIGAVVVLLPDVPLLFAMLVSQDVNGILLPVVLIFMLKLINDRRIMGEYANHRAQNVLAWSTVVFLILLTIILLISSILELIR